MPRYWIYIIIMAVITYLIRVLPFTFFKKEIKNRTVLSFLYYVPYVTLSVMIFPDILYSTRSVWSGLAALITGIALCRIGGGLLSVSAGCCIAVFVFELFLL